MLEIPKERSEKTVAESQEEQTISTEDTHNAEEVAGVLEDHSDESSVDSAKPAEGKFRKTMLVGLLVLGLLGGGIWGFRYWQWSQVHVATDDAYLTGDIVQISPEVTGQLTKVLVHSNQKVQRGELMLVMDDALYRADVQKAKANLAAAVAAWHSAEKSVLLTSATGDAEQAEAVGEVAAAQSGVGVAKAVVDQSKSSIKNAKAALAGSHNEIQTAKAAISASQAQRAQAKQQANAAQAAINAAQAKESQVRQSTELRAADVEAAAAAVAGAEQEVLAATAAVATAKANVSAAQAAVDSAQAEADEAVNEAQRYEKLVQGGAASQQVADAKEAASLTANAHLQAAKNGVASAKAVVDQRQAEVASSQQQVRAAKAAYAREQSHSEQTAQLIAAASAEVAKAEAKAKAAIAAVRAADATTAQNVSKLAAAHNAVKQAKTVVEQNQAALQASRQNVAMAGGKVQQAQGQLQQAKTSSKQVGVSKSAVEVAHAQVLQAKAALKKAQIDLKHTRIYAPVSGVVSKNSAQIGMQVRPGIPVLAVVPERVWVVANYKETQLTDIRVGQPVEVDVDAFPGYHFKAHVDSISAATGATFALLPPENASGNFTKVVQRVPVKIVFEPGQNGLQLLRGGLSVVSIIDTERIVKEQARSASK